MKEKLFVRLSVLFVILAVFNACAEKLHLDSDSSEMKVQLKVMIPVAETRLTSPMSENTIKNYQVFVFDGNGVMEAYVNQTSADIILDCTVGEKTVAVVTNAPALSDVTTASALESKVTVLSDNDDESLIMTGRENVTVTDDADVEVSVSRLVSKVRLSKLQVAFETPQYQNTSFNVSSVYLINVPAESRYFTGISPSLWYNKQQYVVSDANALIYDDMKSAAVTASLPYSSVNTFYCYPNLTDSDSFEPTWSARHTRLVVEAYLGTTKYYYPVTLPKLEANKVYDVNLTITRPGASAPDTEVDKFAADFTVVVKDWETGASVMEEI